MVDSIYRQQFIEGGEDLTELDDAEVVVDDDELLADEARRLGGSSELPHRRSIRSSRRVPRSTLRPDVPRPGDMLAGRYVVESFRGRSGPEIVVLARHVELDQRVFVRYLSSQASASPEAVARFQRGARKAREMRSQHGERVVDSGRLETGSPFRVTELPSGPSLDEILKVRGALAIGEAVDIVLSACEPVAEAHVSGIAHRSLCTSNIYVERRADGSQLIKVLEFGVSDALSPDPSSYDGTAPPVVASMDGPLAFASPEQIRNPSAVDARADIWALGAILYELLTGVRVFVAETPLMLLAMIAADQPAPLNWLRPEIPESLERIVLSCLEKDPESRPRSVVELATSLAPFGSGDAQTMVGLVSRIGARSTRPPPLPNSFPAPGPGSRLPRAIMRTSLTSEPIVMRPALPGWAMVAGGALIGIVAALTAALIMIPRPQAQSLPAPTPPEPVVLPTPVVAPPPIPAPVATIVPPAAPTVAAAPPVPAPAPRVVQQRAVRRTEKAEPEVAERARERERPATTTSTTTPAERAAAATPAATAPRALFGGID